MSFVRSAYVFTPTAISNCALWLDAADSSTITIQTGVSQWTDKSGQGRHVTQTTTSLQPVYSSASNALVFNSNAWLGIPNALAAITPTYTIFVVDKRASASVHFFIGMHDATGGNVALILGYNGTTTSHHTTAYITDCMVTIPAYAGAAEPKRLARYDYTGSLRDTYINGGQLSTIQSFSATLPTWNNANIGAGYYTPGVSGLDWWYVGNIHEIIFYNNVLTTVQAQQVEGYLAQKWGLTSSLPVGHPGLTTQIYKADYRKPNIMGTLPYYATFSPRSIADCSLWLDAADTSTVSFSSGSNVSTWNDKSGNGRNATVYAGTPTYTSALGMTFNGSSSLQITYTASPILESMFVIVKFNSVSGQGDILSGVASGQREYLMYYPYSPGTMYLGKHSNGPSGAINGGTVTTSSNYLLGYVFNGTGNTISFFQSGNTITSGTPQFTYSAGGTISLIGSYNGGGYLQGQIYEMVIYSTALSITQRQQVESYLAQKWGLTASLPGSHSHLTKQAGAVTTVANTKFKVVGLPRITFASTGLVITHQDGRTWKATANNPGYANYAIGLNSGTSMSLNIYAGADVFNSAGGRVALLYNGDSNNAVRHAGYVMWTSTFAANNFDFGWKFVSSGSGYLIYNDYPSYSSWQVTYDSGADRVLIVAPEDGRYGMVWNITPRVTLAYVYSSY
jgi:hypothetical protein